MNNPFWKTYYFIRNTMIVWAFLIVFIYALIKLIKSDAHSKCVEKRPPIAHVYEVHIPTREELYIEAEGARKRKEGKPKEENPYEELERQERLEEDRRNNRPK